MSKPTEFAREIENFSDAEWVEFLDELDEVSRRRRQRAPLSSRPAGTGRDDVACWIASRHLAADSSIKEIWYLPMGSPPQEIRLVEVNGRLAGGGWGVEPIDFALDVENIHFKLLVADTTSDELDRARTDPSILPPGWSLSGAMVWGRGT
jgi:hypothetical protein